MIRVLPLAAALALSLAACSSPQHKAEAPSPKPAAPAASPARENPFARESTLPFHAPDFTKIADDDIQPALEEGMKIQISEIEKIAGQTDAPTFDNTIVAMEKTGRMLSRVNKVLSALAQANTDDTLQKIQKEESPKLAAHRDAIFLNAKLFARVKSIYDQRYAAGLDPQSKRLVERYYKNFVRAGAQLASADQEKLRAMNKELSTLGTAFRLKLLAATKAGAIAFDNPEPLAGLSDADIAAASEAAKSRKLDGKWLLTLQNTTQQPAQVSLTHREIRQELFEASTNRAEHNDDNDTRATIERLAQLRFEKAKLLGYRTWAGYALEDQMAKTPDHAIKLMTDVVSASVPKAKREAAKMQPLAKKDGISTFEPWDWQFYSEQVKKKEFKLDENEIKQYFVLDRVLQDGVFFAANKLYGVTFKERHDIPVYQPDVRVFEVFDKDGTSLALWYADYFKRDNKNGGAWMSSFVDQSDLFGTKPVVFNVCNFTKPAPGQPALISHDDVITMFHEFGHALHGMFSRVKYPLLAGTSVPRDFVEFPSQFNEHWADEPSVFANYAKHYQTGAPMPKELVDRIKAAGTFGQGFATTEAVSAGLLDMAWHTLSTDEKPSTDPFEAEALKKYRVDYALVPPRYRSSYFAHIWDNGYAAGYYAYLWTAVLRDDAFYWFKEHGGMTRENGQRFRDMILSKGNTEDLDAAYRAFRGREPSVEPLLIERGLKPEKKKS